jgi:hypothetical protein
MRSLYGLPASESLTLATGSLLFVEQFLYQCPFGSIRL